MNLYNLLEELNIKYDEITHNPIYTIDDAIREDIPSKIDGEECKNLFLKDRDKNYYLVLLTCDKKANLKELAEYLNTSKLSFAESEELYDILKLEKGNVTPLGIINDINNKVLILIDEYFINKKILVHPNVNTKTLAIEYADLIKIIEYLQHNYKIIK